MEGKSEVNIWSYYNTIRYGTYLKGVNMQPKKNQLKKHLHFKQSRICVISSFFQMRFLCVRMVWGETIISSDIC